MSGATAPSGVLREAAALASDVGGRAANMVSAGDSWFPATFPAEGAIPTQASPMEPVFSIAENPGTQLPPAPIKAETTAAEELVQTKLKAMKKIRAQDGTIRGLNSTVQVSYEHLDARIPRHHPSYPGCGAPISLTGRPPSLNCRCSRLRSLPCKGNSRWRQQRHRKRRLRSRPC